MSEENKLLKALKSGKLLLLCPPIDSEKLIGRPFEGSPGCTYEPSTCDFCNLNIHLGTKQKEAYKSGKYIKICALCFFKYAGKELSEKLLNENLISFQEIERETKH